MTDGLAAKEYDTTDSCNIKDCGDRWSGRYGMIRRMVVTSRIAMTERSSR